MKNAPTLLKAALIPSYMAETMHQFIGHENALSAGIIEGVMLPFPANLMERKYHHLYDQLNRAIFRSQGIV